jgi:regulatory protein
VLLLPKRLMSSEQKKIIKNAALTLLAAREYSQFTLARKLGTKGFEKELIVEVLNELLQKSWLNDQRFAENFINSRMHKGYGPLRIQQELKEKGIAAEISEAILDFRNEQWTHLATAVRHKKFGADTIANVNEKSRQMKFLQYRGFTFDQIKVALNNE